MVFPKAHVSTTIHSNCCCRRNMLENKQCVVWDFFLRPPLFYCLIVHTVHGCDVLLHIHSTFQTGEKKRVWYILRLYPLTWKKYGPAHKSLEKAKGEKLEQALRCWLVCEQNWQVNQEVSLRSRGKNLFFYRCLQRKPRFFGTRD